MPFTIPNARIYGGVLAIFIVSFLLIMFSPRIRELILPQYADNSSQASSLEDVLRPLGIYMAFESPQKDAFRCDPKRLPTREKTEVLWQNVCENIGGDYYMGFFWKRTNYQKLAFQNGVLTEFMNNRTKRLGEKQEGTFDCKSNTSIALPNEAARMRVAIVDCITTLWNESAGTFLYSTFVYSYPIESQNLNAGPVIVISSESAEHTKNLTENILLKLNKTNTENQKVSFMDSSYLIEKASASAGGAGAGDGSGDGSGSCGPGDSGCGDASGSGTGGDGSSGGDAGGTDPTPVTPTVTCTTAYYPYSSVSAISNGSCYNSWTNTVQACSDGTQTVNEGSVTSSCSCNPGYTWNGAGCIPDTTTTTDTCAAIDTSLYCPDQSCTTNTGVVRYGTKNCSTTTQTCPAGYTGTYPNCTAPSSETNACPAGYTGTYPNCTAPTTITTCKDTTANNYGAAGACTYDPIPVLAAYLSQSTSETNPGVAFTVTWDSDLATSCTVTYTGPDGGGTLVAPGTTSTSKKASRSGSKVMTLSPLGTYVFRNVCTDSNGSDSVTRTHYVVTPDLTAGPVSPTTVMINTSKTFASTISNIGTGSTNKNFYNLLQLATGANGSGTITDIASTSMSTLDNGRTSVENFTYKFTALGTYSLRVCADKSSMGNLGIVNEGTPGGEDNNCGPWTTINVTDGSCVSPWGTSVPNGSSTTAYSRSIITSGDDCSRYDQIRTCSNSVLSGSYQYSSCGLAVPTVVGFTASPRTVERGGTVKLTWSIQNPTTACKITAAVLIPASCNATCQAERAAASSTLNTALANSNTNSNDPNGGNRNMTSALTTSVSGYAKGEKSIDLDYSTTFTLTCGSASNTVKGLIYVTTRTEG